MSIMQPTPSSKQHSLQQLQLQQYQQPNQKETAYQQDVIIEIEPSIISASGSSTINKSVNKKIKYCSLVLKLVGLLIIVGIVLLFALLPNYLRNKSSQQEEINNSFTDPTKARLPGS
jgi:mannose/fructose/N-acetylgalactosamine-specific phosphotransferase system component IID